MNKKNGVRLVADFGGTRVKYGLVQAGKVIAQSEFDVVNRLSFADQLEPLSSGLFSLLTQNGFALSDCSGFGIGLPTLISADCKRVTRTFEKFEDLVGFDVSAWSKSVFGLSCELENDARAALIGEWRYGAGRGFDHLFMLTLGTGCGTAVILEGNIIRGHSGMAGNMGGHSITHRDGEECWCGSRGCLEAQVASWAIESIARKSKGFSESKLSKLDKVDYRGIFTLAAEGDFLAVSLRDKAIDTWAAVILNGISFFDPQRVIVGGGIMASAAVIIPALQKIVDAQAIQVAAPLQIVSAELGDGAALLGA